MDSGANRTVIAALRQLIASALRRAAHLLAPVNDATYDTLCQSVARLEADVAQVRRHLHLDRDDADAAPTMKLDNLGRPADDTTGTETEFPGSHESDGTHQR